jgi:uncharacterized protein YggE
MKALQLIAILLVNAVVGQAAELPEFPFVFAVGTASTEVPPQKAEVQFTVKAFDATSEVALATVKQTSRELLAFFASLSISNDDITAYDIDKRMVRERKDYQELGILGYEISQEITVTLNTLEEYEVLTLRLLETKNIERLRTTFGRHDREQVEAELVAEACADARRKADQLAKGLGVAMGDVHAVSRGGFETIAAQFGLGNQWMEAYTEFQLSDRDEPNLFALEDDSGAAFVFVPCTLKFEARVYVLFKLGEQTAN